MLPFTTDWVILKKLDKNNLRTCIAIEQVTEAMISGKLKEFVGSKICCYLCDDGIVLGETLDLDGSLVIFYYYYYYFLSTTLCFCLVFWHCWA